MLKHILLFNFSSKSVSGNVPVTGTILKQGVRPRFQKTANKMKYLKLFFKIIWNIVKYTILTLITLLVILALIKFIRTPMY